MSCFFLFFLKTKGKKKYLYVRNGNLLVSWRNGLEVMHPFWVYNLLRKKSFKI